MKELEGKAGIVTGASGGIGFRIADAMARAGAVVYAVSRTGKPKDCMGRSVPGVVHCKGDVGDVPAMQALAAQCAAGRQGILDFLVNNAGITFKCPAEAFPPDQFDEIMRINVKCVFEMSRICFPYLKRSPGKGRVINITSMGAHLGFSEVVPYCASKGAVLAMTRALAVEWAKDGVCVNSIAPGWFRTAMNAQVADPEREAKILGRMPFHAYGDTNDLGAMAVFLAGNGAGYITGQDLAVDGGALAYGY